MLLLSTQSLQGYGIHKIFLLTKESGYDGIDLFIDFDSYDTLDALYLDSLMSDIWVQIRSITAPERRMNQKKAEQILRLASDLGVEIVNFFPPHRLDREQGWFGPMLVTLQEKYPHTKISIVNAPPKTWLFVVAEYGDARPETIKKITGYTSLSIENVEPESGVDLLKTFALMGNTIKHIYLSDKTEEKLGLPLGEGHMPLESLLIKLREAGYGGDFTLDISSESMGTGDDTAVQSRLKTSAEFIARYFLWGGRK